MSRLYDSIEELVLELEDDMSEFSESKTVAIIPGAYRPPHMGHVSMVEQYAQRVDEVVVLVSSALKGNRLIGEQAVTPEQSQQIWQELLSDRGLTNVRVETSAQPTRSSALLEYIGEDGPLTYGTKVIFGVGNNGGSTKRYESIARQAKHGITVVPVSETMVELSNMPSGEPYKSSNLRKILDEGGDADMFFGEGKTASVRSILGLDSPLEEMSAVGAIQGSPMPIKKKKQNEYNELYLYKEVLKLLSKKGTIK